MDVNVRPTPFVSLAGPTGLDIWNEGFWKEAAWPKEISGNKNTIEQNL